MNSFDPTHIQTLKHLLVSRSVILGEITLASGLRSDFYVDARRTTMSAAGQEAMGRVGCGFLKSLSEPAELVGGLTMGADPIAYAIAHRCALEGLAVDAFSVRKSVKAHGTHRRVEGPVRKGMRALVVEDCVTTGGSALSAVRALREFGITVSDVFALVDRSEGRGRERLRQERLSLTSLFTGPDLADAARG